MALLKQPDLSDLPKRKHALLRMIHRQNQAVVEADLEAFFGPKGEVYLRHYRRLVDKESWAISWHWPFLLTGGFGWAFYRRAWGVGTIILVSLVVITVLRISGLKLIGIDLLVLMLTFSAKSTYVQQGFKWIERAEKLGLVGEARRSFLAKAGGTSVIAGVLAGPWFALTIIAGFAAAISESDEQRAEAGLAPSSVSVAERLPVPELRK